MTVFHGSDLIIEHPDVFHSHNYLDFGMGFYTTSVQIQAERWAKRKAYIHGKPTGYVSIYEVKEISDDLIIHDFGDDLESWIDFVCKCRNGSQEFRQYDVIKGRVANDNVIRVVKMYMDGVWEKKRAIEEIRIYESYDQIAYITQKSIDSVLTFKDSYEVKP